MHHEQDMRHYGGLRRDIPITFIVMMTGTLAITGVMPFAGYYSKDAILESAFQSGVEAGYVAFTIGCFAALLTSFYSWRLIFLTFAGKPRWEGSEHIQHAVHDAHDHHGGGHGYHAAHAAPGTAGYHPHESPWVMLVPLILLATGAVFAGLVWHNAFLDPEQGAAFWAGSIAFDAEFMHHVHQAPTWVVYMPMAMWIIGLALAWNSYVRSPSIPARFTTMFRGLYRFLLNKWYFDELYNAIFVKPAFAIGRVLWKRGDQGTIDRFGPDGVSAVVARGAVGAKALQTGYLYTYAFVMLIGVAAAATYFSFYAG
jgi:NADH-quinone oxidoreductase subunit L